MIKKILSLITASLLLIGASNAQVNGYYLVDQMSITLDNSVSYSNIVWPGDGTNTQSVSTPGNNVLVRGPAYTNNGQFATTFNHSSFTQISTNLPETKTSIEYLMAVQEREQFSFAIVPEHKNNRVTGPDSSGHIYLEGNVSFVTSNNGNFNALFSNYISSGTPHDVQGTALGNFGYSTVSYSFDGGITWINPISGSLGSYRDKGKTKESLLTFVANTTYSIHFKIDLNSSSDKASYAPYTNITQTIDRLRVVFSLVPNYTTTNPPNITFGEMPITTTYSNCDSSMYAIRVLSYLVLPESDIYLRMRLHCIHNTANYVPFILFDFSQANSTPCALNLNLGTAISFYVPWLGSVPEASFSYDQPANISGFYTQYVVLDTIGSNHLASNLISW